jgi:hypothetical protein
VAVIGELRGANFATATKLIWQKETKADSQRDWDSNQNPREG